MKEKKHRFERGERGYLAAQKKKRITGTILWILIGVAIYILGLVLNKFSNANVFTIVAMLCALPMAKSLVGFIVLAPYRPQTEEEYHAGLAVIREEDAIFTDLVITSLEKIMNLSFLIVAGREVIGLYGKKPELAPYCQDYLKKEISRRGLSYHVRVVTERQAFLKAVKNAKRPSEIPEDREELIDYLRSLIA